MAGGKMKNVLLLSVLALACCNAHAQSATSTSSGAAQAGAIAIGGGASTSNALGGAGGNGQGGAASSAVTVNIGSTDPTSGGDPATASNAQQVASGAGSTTQVKETLKTVGNPGAASYGVSFSQFNCANTAAVGAGWLGGVFQLGGGVESSPCNDRANASALFQIAGALQTTNAALSSQLYHAAILLIGNSTKETREALAQAGVSDWVKTPPVAAATLPDGASAYPVATPDSGSPATSHH
ncbi:hypothetical protein [Paraburkholderia sp. 35.1]|uniref:hypothetical protein n=1 Tax=Paraburkholderia sp. 35.1 TaxID=2991058 RepID=UPI003D23E899